MGTGTSPSGSPKRALASSVANITPPSTIAKLAPMQFRGPVENGM